MIRVKGIFKRQKRRLKVGIAFSTQKEGVCQANPGVRVGRIDAYGILESLLRLCDNLRIDRGHSRHAEMAPAQTVVSVREIRIEVRGALKTQKRPRKIFSVIRKPTVRLLLTSGFGVRIWGVGAANE